MTKIYNKGLTKQDKSRIEWKCTKEMQNWNTSAAADGPVVYAGRCRAAAGERARSTDKIRTDGACAMGGSQCSGEWCIDSGRSRPRDGTIVHTTYFFALVKIQTED